MGLPAAPADDATQPGSDQILLAWLTGDILAFEYVVEECAADEPGGTPGVLFALVDFTARLGMQAAPDFVEQLRMSLLDQDGDEALGGGRQ